MKAFINWHIFTQTGLDSGSLTMLGAVIHKFPESGEYMGTILRENKDVGSFRLSVDKDCPAMQVDIDLAALYRSARERNRCESSGRFVVNPNGYVVFYVSHGPGGYAVTVGTIGEKGEAKQLFDSRKLRQGDMFAVTMIRPGIYSVTNVNTGAKGEIVVAYPKVGKVAYRPPNPASIECTEKAFTPDKIKIEPAQGQVYVFKTLSRIKIALIKADEGPSEKRRQKISGQKKKVTSQRG
ncbi:MAG: hypothetical protein ACFFCW_34005 [Candidatus Hodarchaeota archaeon]